MRMCDWVTWLYSRKLTEHSKPTIMAKIKIIKKKTTTERKIHSKSGVCLADLWRLPSHVWGLLGCVFLFGDPLL